MSLRVDVLINRKESIQLNRQKRERGWFVVCVCVCVCVRARACARMCTCVWTGACGVRACVRVRVRVYEYVGAVPYMDATFKVSRLAE